MCGIFGVIKKEGKIDIANFKILNSKQIHRGPDEQGIWVNADGRVALGHNRLSIIDLKQGQQPLLDEKRRAVIIYNGEIYNYQDIKRELVKKKHFFTTASDTEVVLRAYLEWGEKCVDYFRGMFAFAIVDGLKKEIFLARDHFGIKPLVYYHDENIFAFASEINILSKIGNLDLSLDLNAIDQYLWLQYIPAPQTAYQKIKKLEPAHLMKIDFNGKIIVKKERYWLPKFAPRFNKNFDSWLDDFEEKIYESVNIHTVADVPYGAFLSGGIDSSLVVGNLKAIADKKIKTFSIGFKEEGYNESVYSDLAAKTYGTEHFNELVTPDFFSVFNELVKHYGEPFGDSSAIPTYYVSKLASQHVKVVLSGDGGDELFGGYNSYIAWRGLGSKKASRPALLNFVRFWLTVFSPRKYVPEKPSLEAWLNIIRYFGYHERKNLWKSEYRRFLNSELSSFAPNKKLFKKLSLVNKAQFFDLLYYLPNDILNKVDVASMANSLEVRVPFIDKKIAEFALTIPEDINVKEDSKWIGKSILKKSLEAHFAQSFIYRTKQGFAIPIDYWFGENGSLYSEPYMRLMNTDSKLFKEYFNLAAVYEFISGGNSSQIYLLLFLEEWLKQYENNKDRIKL